MKSLWQDAARQEILDRLGRLRATQAPAWGRFTAPQMVAHMSNSMRMTFGDLPTASKRLPLRFTPLKQIVIYWLPWPKGAPTAPELIARAPDDWVAELAACRSLVERFGHESPERAWPEHPAFGCITPRQWGVLGYRHFDHHLRQFGV
ncbi:MAG: DUF1569 domain-containing protein [Gemmatimonadaceae bacterium]